MQTQQTTNKRKQQINTKNNNQKLHNKNTIENIKQKQQTLENTTNNKQWLHQFAWNKMRKARADLAGFRSPPQVKV